LEKEIEKYNRQISSQAHRKLYRRSEKLKLLPDIPRDNSLVVKEPIKESNVNKNKKSNKASTLHKEEKMPLFSIQQSKKNEFNNNNNKLEFNITIDSKNNNILVCDLDNNTNNNNTNIIQRSGPNPTLD